MSDTILSFVFSLSPSLYHTHTHNTHTHIYVYMFMGFPGGSAVKNSPANEGNADSIPGLGRFPGEGNGNP